MEGMWKRLQAQFERPPHEVEPVDAEAAEGDEAPTGENAEGLREAGDELQREDLGLRKASPAELLCDASPLTWGSRERWRQRWRYVAFGERTPPLPSYRGPVEPPHAGKTGICCSGGGIRSAAYNLGALQALHESTEKELQKAD